MVGAAHQAAEQARQLGDQHARGFRLRADQRRDRRQRVEQEVRVDLVRERLDLRREQQLFLLLQPVLDARVVPDLDRRRDARAPSRAGRRASATATSSGAPCEREQAVVSSSATPTRLAAAARARPARAAARPASPPASTGSSATPRRCSPVKTNGEKCQIDSFGQSSRRPPPAKPQPTANGSAPHSPAPSGGMPTMRADDRAGVRAGDEARRETSPSSVRSAAL